MTMFSANATALDFQPVPEEVASLIGATAWQAHRGTFTFTIASHEALGGFEIAVAFNADYLPQGPFETFEEAAEACNKATQRLRC